MILSSRNYNEIIKSSDSLYQQKVGDFIERIGENLNLDQERLEAGQHLLKAYIIIEYYLGDDEKYKWFLDRYKGRLKYIINNKMPILGYHEFLVELFNDLLDKKIVKLIKDMDLNSYIMETEDEEIKQFLDGLNALREDGVKIDSWDKFKENWIEYCRGRFPNVEKSLYRQIRFSSKFKLRVKDLFSEKVKKECMDMLSMISIMKENFSEEQINQLDEQYLIQENKKNIDSISEVISMAMILDIFDRGDYFRESDFLKFYARNVYSEFKERSQRIDTLRTQSSDTEGEGLMSYIFNEEPIQVDTKRISEKDLEILSSIVNSMVKVNGLDEEKAKELKKYLKRLFSNGRNCRISSLKNIFGINIIDEDVKTYFDQLENMKLENDVKEDEEKYQEDLNVEDGENTSSEFDNLETRNNLEQSKEDEILTIDPDPVDVFYVQIRKYSKYKIPDEGKLKLEKQIQDLCKDASFKKILCAEMQKHTFGKPVKKQGKDYHTIEIGNTGYRFILIKEDKTYCFDGLYSHGEYENRVKSGIV